MKIQDIIAYVMQCTVFKLTPIHLLSKLVLTLQLTSFRGSLPLVDNKPGIVFISPVPLTTMATGTIPKSLQAIQDIQR